MSTLKFAFFRPFWRFCDKIGTAIHHQRKKPPQRRTGGQNRPRCAAAPVRFALGGLSGCPSAWPCAPLGAGQGSLFRALRFARPAVVPPACAPCSSLPSASAALLLRLNGALCADGREWAANNRALVPPGLRRRRPPRRRAAVRWRGRARAGAWGGGVAAPAPAGRLCAVGLVGLAAGRALPCVRATGWRVAFAPFRRARGLPPGACLADGRSVCRGVGQSWPFCFAGACPPSPAAPV